MDNYGHSGLREIFYLRVDFGRFLFRISGFSVMHEAHYTQYIILLFSHYQKQGAKYTQVNAVTKY